MGQQRDLLQPQFFDQALQVVDVAGQAILVAARLVGEAAANMVGNDQAKPAAQAFHQFPPVERPGGVSVDKQQRLACSLIEIVVAQAVDPDFPRWEMIQILPGWRGRHVNRQFRRRPAVWAGAIFRPTKGDGRAGRSVFSRNSRQLRRYMINLRFPQAIQALRLLVVALFVNPRGCCASPLIF